MLDINLTSILFQMANFAIMAALLYFLLFKRVSAKVEKRKEQLARIEAETKENYSAAEQAKAKAEKQLAAAQSLIDERVSRAKSELEVNRIQIIDITRKEAEHIIKEAVETAEIEQMRSLEKYNDELTTAIIEIVKNLLHQYSPEVIHNSLVQQTNERIWELGKKEMERVEAIRHSLHDREPTLALESAFPLSKEQQANLIRTFSALADRNLYLDLSINTDLGSGIRVRLGDFIINNSLDALLNDIEQQAKQQVADFIADQKES
jgi:F0F1-type ATP synthase membrane subunit b/b'